MMIAIAMMVIVMFMDAMVRPTVSTILVVSAVLKVVVFLVRISQLIVRILVGVSLVTVLVLVLVVVVGMLFTALVGDLRPVTLMIRFVLHDLWRECRKSLQLHYHAEPSAYLPSSVRK